MKAIFIGAHGALLEGSGARCLLRCGAGAGLRLLVERDFRLVVIDDGAPASPAGQSLVSARWPAAPGRRPDNGERRRRTDAAMPDAFAQRPSVDVGVPMSAHITSTNAAPQVNGDGRFVDRLADLFFREQLALLGYYRCRHAQLHAQTAQPVWHSWLARPARPEPAARPACFCRPPQPALLLQAAFEHRIDLAASWLIGAHLDDIEAGNRAGCRTVLIDNGSETRWQLGRARVPTVIAPDVHGAALLMGEHGSQGAPYDCSG